MPLRKNKIKCMPEYIEKNQKVNFQQNENLKPMSIKLASSKKSKCSTEAVLVTKERGLKSHNLDEQKEITR